MNIDSIIGLTITDMVPFHDHLIIYLESGYSVIIYNKYTFASSDFFFIGQSIISITHNNELITINTNDNQIFINMNASSITGPEAIMIRKGQDRLVIQNL